VTEQGKAAPDRVRAGISFRALALFGLGAACVAALGTWIAYGQFIHYDRRALAHVPAGAELVARLNVEKVPLFEPVRRHLLPLIDKLPLLRTPPNDALSGEGRLARLRNMGFNIAVDLREIVIADVSEPPGWVVVLGGLYDADGFVPTVEAVLRAEAVTGVTRVGDTLRFAPSGVMLGQAADGSLIVASDPTTLASALPASEHSASLGLTATGTGELFATAEWLHGGWSRLDQSASEPTWLGLLRSIGITLRLDSDLHLDGRLEAASPGQAHELESAIERWRQAQQLTAPSVPRADWGGERAILARTQIGQTAGSTVFFTSAWERAEFDRAVRSLASGLERRLALPSRVPH
jgi:hypothetical protein